MASRTLVDLKVGDVFTFRMPNRKWGIFNILKESTPNSCPHGKQVLVTLTRWVGDDMPTELPKPTSMFRRLFRLDNPLLRPPLIGRWLNIRVVMFWIGDGPRRRGEDLPDTFKHIGVIRPTATQAAAIVGSWFPYKGFSWDTAVLERYDRWREEKGDPRIRYPYDPSHRYDRIFAEAQEKIAEEEQEVRELRTRVAEVERELDDDRKRQELDARKDRRCPRCGRTMRYGTNSDWPSVSVWWCEMATTLGCGYEITPANHPDEFKGLHLD